VRRVPVLAAVSALVVSASPAGSDGEPSGYAMRLPLQTQGSGRLQRVDLPGAAYVAARTHDLSDVRVFDARGRAMPIARQENRRSEVIRYPLAVVPILGPAGGLTVRDVTLEPDGAGGVHVARARATVADDPGRTAVLGALLDVRRFDGRGSALLLEAEAPERQPVTFTAEASHDLSSWRRLGERTVLRPPGSADRSVTVPLDGAGLRRAYLRVTWRGANGHLLAPVRIVRAELSGHPRSASVETKVCAEPPPPADRHLLEFAAPSAVPVATLRITPAADDALLPVRVLGRDTPERPWTLLGRGTASRAAPPVRLTDAAFRAYRVEAGPASPGFAAAPGLCFGFAPRTILFLAAGRAPYALAVGRVGGASAYLAAADLADAAPGPASTATAESVSARLRLRAPDAASVRSATLLWSILVAGTVLLAGLVWLLWRRGSSLDEPR